jgi:hypothetical protein
MPLSIMVVGMESDGCGFSAYSYGAHSYPKDISKEVVSANGNMERLLELVKSLKSTSRCDFGSYTPLGFINRVYYAPNYGAGSYQVQPGDTFLDDQIVVGSLNDPEYKIKLSYP